MKDLCLIRIHYPGYISPYQSEPPLSIVPSPFYREGEQIPLKREFFLPDGYLFLLLEISASGR